MKKYTKITKGHQKNAKQKCLHCDNPEMSRGVCSGHYSAVIKLAQEWGWDYLIEKGYCLESKQGRVAESYYDNLKKKIEEHENIQTNTKTK